MKHYLILLLSLALVGTTAHAEKSSTKKGSKKEKTPIEIQTRNDPAPVNTGPKLVRFAGTAGLGIIDGFFTIGAGFRADYPVWLNKLPVRLGGETGIYRISVTGQGVTIIPIALSAEYAIPAKVSPKVDFYGRAAMGLDVAMAGSTTTTKFHGVLEPGMNFYNKQFFVALPFGTQAGGFLLMPTFGIRF